MRAWVLERQNSIEKRPLSLQNIPDPLPEEGEIRIQVKAVGICRTDIHIAEGDLPLKTSPLILGHEVVGVVDEIGNGVDEFRVGDRAGIAWLNSACGKCEFCRRGLENLCPEAKFTGWDVNGGFAEYTAVSQDFAFKLPSNIPFHECAPLMCPGIAGYRSFTLCDLKEGERLGLYGFGITATYVLQVAKMQGMEVYAITRSEENREAAKELGADWVGGYDELPPMELDAGIIFPAAGELVPIGLGHLRRGGRLILAPVTMTPIVINDFNLIWMEREIKSLAHVTRKDGRELLKIASENKLKTRVETFGFDELQDAMIKVRKGEIKSNAVIVL
jgi:alcohol dehydrogenase, propanol-preferring